jgi:deazaflavin-dependent oxidoreductase (nitroreductase family)
MYAIFLYLYQFGYGRFLGWLPICILTTRNRQNEQSQYHPITFRRHGSKYYVISEHGKEPIWYQNIISDPIVTIEQGNEIFSARAILVEDAAESLRALYLFHRHSAIYGSQLVGVHSNERVDIITLSNRVKDYCIIRLERMMTPPILPKAPRQKRGWLIPVILSGLVLLWITTRIRTKENIER